MKVRFVTAAIPAALVVCAPMGFAQGQIKLEVGPAINENGGFEAGKGMYYFTKPTLSAIDNDEVYRGQAALRLTGEGTADKAEANICVQGFKIPAPESGTRYLMRIAVRARNVDPRFAPSVQFRREDAAKNLAVIKPALGAIDRDCDWRSIEIVSEPLPAGTTTLSFWLHLPSQSKATVWFDEIEVRKVLNPQAVVDTALTAPAPPPLPVVAPVAPVNVPAPAAVAQVAPSTAAGWMVELNHPQLGVYERGDEAYADLKWTGAGPIPPAPAFGIYNELGNKLREVGAVFQGNSGRITLPSNKMGYFELRPEVANPEAVIPALGSRPAGRLTYAVVDKIRTDRTKNFTSAFLSTQGTNILPGAVNGFGWPEFPYLGVQMQGVGYSWGRLEVDGPGTFEKNIADDHQPEWVRDGKLVPYFHLNGIPMWAADSSRLPEKERTGKSTQRVPPKDWAQWQDYLEKVVPYIVKHYDFLPQRTYEIMWEPVIPWGWYGTPEELVKNFEIAYKVIHRLDPKARIAGPTLSGLNDTAYYETLLKAGLGQYLDVVSFHPYKGYPPEKNAIPEALRNIREVTKKYAGRELPFIGTEFGFPQGVTGSALNQGYGLTASVLIFKGEGARQHTLFYMSDYAGEPGYGMNYNLVPGLPFGTGKISPKPGVPMIRAAIDEVGDAEPVGKLDYFGADIWGYVFRENGDGTLLAALWDASDKNRSIDFETGSPKVELVDTFGNRTELGLKDTRIKLSLGRAPIYVRGISPELYGPGKIAPLIQTDEVWKVYRGHRATFDLGFTRPMGTGAANLTFDTAGDVSPGQVNQTASVKPGSKVTVSFDVAPTAPLGPAAGYIRLRQGDTTLYRGVQRLDVAPELEIERPKVRRANGSWAAYSTVRNLAPFTWNGSATLKVAGQAVPTQAVRLASGASKELVWPIAGADPTSMLGADLQLKSAEGVALDRDGRLSFFEIQKRPEGADFWGKLRSVDVKGTSETVWKQHPDAVFKGDADLSAKLAYAYDADNLYVQALVRDDVHRQDAGPGTTWTEDSLQLAFDVIPGRSENANLVAEGFERTRSEWCFAFTPRGPEIFVHATPGGSTIPEGSLVHFPGAKLAGGREGDITAYRITLPWKLLDPKGVRDPQRLALAAGINDSDAETKFGDRRGIELFGGILRTKNPAEFGVGQLVTR